MSDVAARFATVLAPTYPLRTHRLDLRPYEESDADFLFAMQSDPELTRFLPYGPLDRAVVGRIDPRNTASAAVLTRLGMRHEAHLVENEWVKGEWASEGVYALLAAEWSAARVPVDDGGTTPATPA